MYIGVTSDLPKRVYEHKQELIDGITKKYNVHNLVYYEAHSNIEAAITREKQIKKWSRAWKIALIEKTNPEWRDLYCDRKRASFNTPFRWLGNNKAIESWDIQRQCRTINGIS